MLPISKQEDSEQTVQFRYAYDESDIRNYITKEMPSSRRGKIVLAIALLFLLLSCLVEIAGTIAMNVSPSFDRLWSGDGVDQINQLSVVPCLLFFQFLVFTAIVFIFVPTRLTTQLFHSLTWDGKEMLITIGKEGWSRETKHWLTVVRFEGLNITTQETKDAIVIGVSNGPVLFLAKNQLSAEVVNQLHELLPMLTTDAKN